LRMSEQLKQASPIQDFPNDNVKRVVWWYGAVYKNGSALSKTPLIDIALREIINYESNELGEATIVKISLPLLDIVRLGTVWVGQHNTGRKWDNYNGTKTESLKLEFDCSSPMVESINFLDSKPCSDTSKQKSYTIPAYKYNLWSIDKDSRYTFFNSKITKLLSVNNITVLIPALELLTSTYAPKGQDIRRELFSHSIDEVLALHIDLEQSTGDVDGIYNITLKRDRHDTNIAFLAYLLCNHVSRSRASKIWSCLTTKRPNPNGVIYDDHYPEILPYHPGKLKLECDGIRLNENIFLVFRINKYSMPDNHLIYSTIKEKGRSRGNAPKGDDLYVPSEHTVTADLPVTSEFDPGNNAGTAYITSEVKSDPDQSIIRQSVPETDFENNANIHALKPEIPAQLSSGEVSSSIDSKNTAKLKQSEIENKQSNERQHVDQSQIIREVHNALVDLINSSGSKIQSIKYIDETANLFDNFSLAIFPTEFFGKKGIGKWPAITYKQYKDDLGRKRYKITPRHLIIAKITLKNTTSAYLLEIERKTLNEGFCGLIFNPNQQELTTSWLKNFLKEIAINKGAFRKRDEGKSIEIPLPVHSYYIYDHSLIKGSIVPKIKKAISAAADKGVFLVRH
jgi:hypothetical protein